MARRGNPVLGEVRGHWPGALTCVAVENLAGGRLQLKHFQAGAVRGHHNVGVLGPEEPDVQHLLTVAGKLWGQEGHRPGPV